MNTKFTVSLLLLLGMVSSATFAQKSNFAVEVAAFAEPVGLGYFKELKDVYETLDVNYIYRYYIDVSSESEAENKRQEAKEAGFVNARVINFKTLNENCSATCQYIPPKKTGKKIGPAQQIRKTYVDPMDLYCIFFDFDRSYIRTDAKEELEKLVTVLKQHPDYTVQVMAHTDSKGSQAYNEALSMRRANSTRDYLLKRGISSKRIERKTFGEGEPVALNESSAGEDLAQGRQYNRRVEFRLFNGSGTLVNIVNKIRVPESVQR